MIRHRDRTQFFRQSATIIEIAAHGRIQINLLTEKCSIEK